MTDDGQLRWTDEGQLRWYDLTYRVGTYAGEIVITDWVKFCGELDQRVREILPASFCGGVTWVEVKP